VKIAKTVMTILPEQVGTAWGVRFCATQNRDWTIWVRKGKKPGEARGQQLVFRGGGGPEYIRKKERSSCPILRTDIEKPIKGRRAVGTWDLIIKK